MKTETKGHLRIRLFGKLRLWVDGKAQPMRDAGAGPLLAWLILAAEEANNKSTQARKHLYPPLPDDENRTTRGNMNAYGQARISLRRILGGQGKRLTYGKQLRLNIEHADIDVISFRD